MSYTKYVSGTVHYHDSVTVSYPASEHGGSTTASVSGSIPVNIEVHVDTTPFDNSVGNCNAKLNQLTGSVVALNAAEVAAIRQSAQNVSQHVTDGFYSMINSEISQNMAQLYSTINAKLGLIRDRAQKLVQLRERMERDYALISRRYMDIFDQLDQECRRSIVSLDKQAFMLAENVQRKQFSEPQSKQTAFLVTGMNEGQTVNQQLSMACLHSKVNRVLNVMTDTLTQEAVYARKVQSMLREKPLTSEQTECIPVIYSEEADMDTSGAVKKRCWSVLEGEKASALETSVKDEFQNPARIWGNARSAERDSVQAAFNRLAEQHLNEGLASGDAKAQRIYDMIMKLYRENPAQVNA